MKYLILNGSPKANSKDCHSQFFIESFIAELHNEVTVKYIYKENPNQLAKEMASYDIILMVMPLYIHAMPSGVMALIEAMSKSNNAEKALGFIVQAGFPESYHEKWLCEYFECLAKRLNYRYIGTVVKGGCAFIEHYPEQKEKLRETLVYLGKQFGKTGYFDEKIKKELAMPYQFGKVSLAFLKVVSCLGGIDGDWKKSLKENHALEDAKAQPFYTFREGN